MKAFLFFIFILFIINAIAQYNPSAIHTDAVLYGKRQSFDKYLRETVIAKTFKEPLDSNAEYLYESACLAISQFMIDNEDVKAGFDSLLLHYDSLEYATKRAFIEAAFTVYPHSYTAQVAQLIPKETEPKLFCMLAVYLYANDSTKQNTKQLQVLMHNNFGVHDTAFLLQQLTTYLTNNTAYKQKKIPDLNALFAYRKAAGAATIYSFQRWNRDFPGIAALQRKDGRFARDSSGRLLLFRQLARSASNMPYFLTSGNTPQGVYRIWSTAVGHNNIIGPTPTIQMVMPFEQDSLYWQDHYDASLDELRNYINQLPVVWRNYIPVLEAYFAGKAGRSEIIAHGSTIDPDYFKGKPYYPLSPTLGCLCAKENWNMFTGKINVSDQLSLVNTFIEDNEEETGSLIVINLNNEQQAVSMQEVEKLVNAFEQQQSVK